MKDIHTSTIETAGICVDQINSIFLVRKTNKGVDYPVHVQMKLHDSSPVIFCEWRQCMTSIKVARNSNFKSFQCEHLKRVESCVKSPPNVSLTNTSLEQLATGEHTKLISPNTITNVNRLLNEANSIGVPLIVKYPSKEGNRYQHFSIFNDKKDYYARLGRCVVTFDSKDATLDCGCCRQNRSCVHKAICLWFLKETNDVPNVQLDAEDPCIVDVVYPPKEARTIKAMCQYIRGNKTIPWPIPSAYMKVSESSHMDFIPSEKLCHICNTQLSPPIQISNKAKLLTSNGLIENVTTYCKVCPTCRLPVRYQEYKESVHNYDDIFMISYELLDTLEKGLECSIALGRHTDLINRRLNTNIRPQNIINSFLHFEALCDRKYSFNCVVCGHHPERE